MTGHDLAMCTCGPEIYPHPALHQKQPGQEIKGGDSALLLHSGETPPGVLHRALGSPPQEGHEPLGPGPEEGHTNRELQHFYKYRLRELGFFTLEKRSLQGSS